MSDEGKQMTSVRVSMEVQQMINVIKDMLVDGEVITTQDDALAKFIQDNHPEIYKRGIALAENKKKMQEFRKNLSDDN